MTTSHGKYTTCACRFLRYPQVPFLLIPHYLEANSLASQRTELGLHYIVEQEGNGSFPTATSSVTVNYEGFLLDGTRFDGNDDITFSLQQVMAGWTEGIPKFPVGGSGHC